MNALETEPQTEPEQPPPPPPRRPTAVGYGGTDDGDDDPNVEERLANLESRVERIERQQQAIVELLRLVLNRLKRQER